MPAAPNLRRSQNHHAQNAAAARRKKPTTEHATMIVVEATACALPAPGAEAELGDALPPAAEAADCDDTLERDSCSDRTA
jgi:hypothetical protein